MTTMTSEDLIGAVAAAYLRERMSENEGEGTARFIIDSLTAEQTAAVARAILCDADLAERIELKLPAHFMEGQGLPASVLTEERATYFRNFACTKPALLVANTGDDEEQSLKELVQVGSLQLRDHPELWIRIAREGLPLSDEHATWWARALTGVQDLHMTSLVRLAHYVLRTREIIDIDGEPLVRALGIGLPALQIPRDSSYFNGIAEKFRTHASRWRTYYASAANKRAPYLTKFTPAHVLLTEEDLESSFDGVRESVPVGCHATVEQFIHASSGWNDCAAALAEYEWEDIKPLFDGLKREAFNLGAQTLAFYDDDDPALLTDDEREYLKRLIARKTTQADDDDMRFYEEHRGELKDDAKLKSRWERFVYGAPRESDDFMSGIVQCMEALFASPQPASTGRRLTISCDRARKKDLLYLNVEAGLYFAWRYRGLKALLGRRVHWRVGELFAFDELVEQWRRKSTSPSRSLARKALELTFKLHLEVDLATGGTQTHTAQLIWRYNPNRVTAEFVDDWTRLRQHPLVFCRASRNRAMSKGQAKTVDLSNVQSLAPAFNKDSGSFVAVYNAANNIATLWRRNLDQAVSEGSLAPHVAEGLRGAFDTFKGQYASAIEGFATSGVVHGDLIGQLDAYGEILTRLCRDAMGDRNRDLLLRPLLQVGTVAVDGGSVMAIVTPWHPLRLAAMARKAAVVRDLVRSLLAAERVYFGDARLYFRDLQEALSHPFYPEVVLGWRRDEPVLLSATDVVGDYSLHETPVVGGDGGDNKHDTNENPNDAASQVQDLVRRYVRLYPHERANLSVVLYNCDSARLPQAVVDKIGALYEDEDDVRCQVILRHRDSEQLGRLYETILETSDSDPDSINASEATQDFMAQLRISIMAHQVTEPDAKDSLRNRFPPLCCFGHPNAVAKTGS